MPGSRRPAQSAEASSGDASASASAPASATTDLTTQREAWQPAVRWATEHGDALSMRERHAVLVLAAATAIA